MSRARIPPRFSLLVVSNALDSLHRSGMPPALRWLVELLHGCLVEPNLDGLDTVKQHILIG